MTSTNVLKRDKELKIGCGLRNIGECVICIIKSLFEKSKCSTSSTDPSTLYEKLKKTNARFSVLLNRKQQDAHEFLKLLTEVMTNKVHPNFTFGKKFLADVNTEIECSLCNTVFLRNNGDGISEFTVNIRGQHSVEKALQSYFEAEDIEEYACVVCMKKVLAKKKFVLTSTPECLCIQLNRFENRRTKIESNIEINPELRLKCHVDNEEHEFKYRLASVVLHIGRSLVSGHYIAIANSQDKLYRFDDSNVNEATEISGRDAYMLFYECVEETEMNIVNNSPQLITTEVESMENVDECMMNDIEKNGVYIENEVINNIVESTQECTINEIIEKYGACIENEVIPNDHQSSNEDSEVWIPIEIEEMNSDEICRDSEFMENEVITTEVVRNKVNNRGNAFNQKEDKLSSRRIVDIEYVFRQMERSFNIACKHCKGEMTYEKEAKRGLISTFHFTCKSCAKKKMINSCPKNKNQANNNEAAVLGIISVGLGFYHLEEFLTHFNIHCMTYQTFYNTEKKLQDDYNVLAKKLEYEALAKEIQLAKDNNMIDSAGNALIGVKGDGSWPKRSYGSNFSSLAGCASLIGIRTNKIIYCGVKSKYCHTCKIAESKNSPPNFHKCKINYTGPSSGMESAIIVDGFKHCVEKGARFDKFVGDFDSSTYKTIRDLRLYKNPSIFTMKYGCVNHLHKNFLKKFFTLVARPKFKASRRDQIISRKIGKIYF